jgi:DMSO reductase family type II enzyme heme b subunit
MQRVSAEDSALMDPASRAWDGVEAAEVKLDPTPVNAQPSMYVQAKWKEIPYGTLPTLSVRSAHNGDAAYFRLAWTDDTANDAIRDTDQFGDAAAVLFPVKDDASLQSMGSPDEPVNAWYWRADLEAPYNITAQGTGSTSRGEDSALHAVGDNRGEGWSLVISRSLGGGDEGHVALNPGAPAKVAFGIWQGANKERGGLKAVTLEWVPLEIEA